MTNELRRHWELTGIIGDRRGIVDRPIKAGFLNVPQWVRLEGDRLRFALSHNRKPAPPGILQAFIEIQSPKDILSFANKWGPLRICRHGLPATHRPFRYLWHGPFSRRRIPSCHPRIEQSSHWEPIESWFQIIRNVTSLLDFSSKLKAGIGPTRADWNRLIDWTTIGAPLKESSGILTEPISKAFLKSFAANLRQDIETLQSDPNKLFKDKTILNRIRLGDAIIDGSDHPKAVQIRVNYGYGHVWDILNVLIELSDLRPYLHREAEINGKFQLSFFTGEAFQAIVLELVLAISNTNGLAVCSACPRSYIPERQPMAGRRNYCPSCRAGGIPVRDAAREYRKRNSRSERKIK